jgi:hypothetical protein
MLNENPVSIGVTFDWHDGLTDVNVKYITKSMAYGTCRYNAAFIKVLQ